MMAWRTEKAAGPLVAAPSGPATAHLGGEKDRLVADAEEWLKGHRRGGVGGSLSVVRALVGLISLSAGRGFQTKGGYVKGAEV